MGLFYVARCISNLGVLLAVLHGRFTIPLSELINEAPWFIADGVRGLGVPPGPLGVLPWRRLFFPWGRGSGVPLLCVRASRIPLHPLTRLRSGLRLRFSSGR
jgi:hypothetical protein